MLFREAPFINVVGYLFLLVTANGNTSVCGFCGSRHSSPRTRAKCVQLAACPRAARNSMQILLAWPPAMAGSVPAPARSQRGRARAAGGSYRGLGPLVE